MILSVHWNHHDGKVSGLRDEIKEIQSKMETLESAQRRELVKLNKSLTKEFDNLLEHELAKLNTSLTKEFNTLLENEVLGEKKITISLYSMMFFLTKAKSYFLTKCL